MLGTVALCHVRLVRTVIACLHAAAVDLYLCCKHQLWLLSSQSCTFHSACSLISTSSLMAHKCPATLGCARGKLLCISFYSSQIQDAQVVSCSNICNLQVKIWNVQSGFCFVTFSDHTAPVTAVAFLPSGSVVVTASLDGTVRAFDLVRYRNFRTMTSPHPVQFVSLAVDPAGEVQLHPVNPAPHPPTPPTPPPRTLPPLYCPIKSTSHLTGGSALHCPI